MAACSLEGANLSDALKEKTLSPAVQIIRQRLDVAATAHEKATNCSSWQAMKNLYMNFEPAGKSLHKQGLFKMFYEDNIAYAKS